MNNNLPIGIFDSGLGGLTVLQALRELLPNESFIYIGDTAHVPYGNKSNEAVTRYSEKITKFLISKKVKLIIVACNTASSVAINELQTQFLTPDSGSSPAPIAIARKETHLNERQTHM